MQKLLTFFQQNISIYAIFKDQSFNDTLTNNIVSFEQLSRGMEMYHVIFSMVILSFLLIQEEQLSVTGEICTQVLVNCLEDQENVSSLNAQHDINSVDWAAKLHCKSKCLKEQGLFLYFISSSCSLAFG